MPSCFVSEDLTWLASSLAGAPCLRIASAGSGARRLESWQYEVPLATLLPGGQPLEYAAARRLFAVRVRAAHDALRNMQARLGYTAYPMWHVCRAMYMVQPQLPLKKTPHRKLMRGKQPSDALALACLPALDRLCRQWLA